MAKKNTAPYFEAKEWNASGSIYMYGSEVPRIFVVEVTTTEDIKGDLLQQAVDRALERLPYYRWTLVRQKGLYYYAENDLPFVVAQSDEPRRIGGETTNYHMVDVTYHGPVASFAMAHGFCDGLGLNRLIEATLYHYFCLKDGRDYVASQHIFTDTVPYDPSEVEDMFTRDFGVDTKDLKKLKNNQKRFRLPELSADDAKGPRMYRMPINIKTEDLLGWGKACGASPTASVTAMMQKVVVSLCDVNDEEAIVGTLPYSLRRGLGTKTFKNCDSAVFLSATPEQIRTMTTGELAAMMRQVMKPQLSDEVAKLKLAGLQMLINLGKKAPTYYLKNKMLCVPEKNPQDTFSVDYVGGLNTGAYSDQITGVSYLNADPFKGSLFILMSETAGYFHLNFTQTFDNDRYYEAFCKVLDAEGIPYERLPFDSYLNPEMVLPQEQKK